jgi:hypothetical protein
MGLVKTQPPVFRLLPYLFAAGAVFWLVQLTQFAAVLASPVGRDEVRQALVDAGVTQNLDSVLVVEAILVGFLQVVAAALHGTAFYGLRGYRDWGWVFAVVIAAGWCLVLVGIPVLVFLLRRPTRHAYGIT